MNVNGLDTENHYSCARDVAIASAELMKHKDIEKYLTIWMDSLRNGEFGLANTNKLIRYYEGANGIKTGSTSDALYCLSAAAKRGDMQLIAVVLGAPTTTDRFNSASRLLDYGFAGWGVVAPDKEEKLPKNIAVVKGARETADIKTSGTFSALMEKGKLNLVEKQIHLPDSVNAPVEKGQKIGSIKYTLDGNNIGTVDIVASETVKKMNPISMFWDLVSMAVSFSV
jgi:D-alanyl-D-alanine carboxypeptidase (penicillin-binding protein 5/6)